MGHVLKITVLSFAVPPCRCSWRLGHASIWIAVFYKSKTSFLHFLLWDPIKKNLVTIGINHQPQLVTAGFLNHQQYYCDLTTNRFCCCRLGSSWATPGNKEFLVTAKVFVSRLKRRGWCIFLLCQDAEERGKTSANILPNSNSNFRHFCVAMWTTATAKLMFMWFSTCRKKQNIVGTKLFTQKVAPFELFFDHSRRFSKTPHPSNLHRLLPSKSMAEKDAMPWVLWTAIKHRLILTACARGKNLYTHIFVKTCFKASHSHKFGVVFSLKDF